MALTDGPHRERTENVVQTPTTVAGVNEVAASDRVEASPAPSSVSRVRTTSGSRFAPDAVIAAAIGLVLGVTGLIAAIRGGFAGPMSIPVVKVLGFTHTTTLGLIEIGLGACLLISGAMRSRAGAMFFGGVLGIGGFVGAVQTSSFHTSLALEASMAWIAVIAGAVVVLAALLLPRFARSSSTIR
jgi:hypothetical protein